MIFPFSQRKPYRGGPLFDRLSTHCFDLGGTGLELTVPASDLVMKEPPRMLNFPFQNAGWFDAHCKRNNMHDELSVFCEVWSYFPTGTKRMASLLATGSNERMGGLCINVDLNRVEKGQELNLNDRESLGTYIKWEYGQHYDSVREECARRWKHGQPDQNDSDRLMYKSSLETYIKPLPNFNTAIFGGEQYTHFNLKKGWAVTTDFYCMPLSEMYYLEIEMEFRFEVSDRNYDILMPDMQKTAEWLLQHIKIASPGKPGGPLPLPQ